MFKSLLMSPFLHTLLYVLIFAASALSFAEERNSVSIAAPWEIASVDPAVSGFAFQRLSVMETLVDADAEGSLRPGLATEWAASDDGLTWTFTLRQGVMFHDGTALTAEAVETALVRALTQPGVLSKAPVTEIKAGDGVVVITLTTPFAALPALLAHSTTIIPAPATFDGDGAPLAAIGSGAFQIKTLSLPQSMELVRFEDYWGEKPLLTEVSYLAAGRAETRALLAESGDADLVFTLDPSGFARLAAIDNVETVVRPIPRVVTLKVNAGHPFLNSPQARRALSLAIDREGIAAGIIRFPEASATQLFPPALGDWHDTSLDPLAFDPEAAEKLLAELGWVKGDDGILSRDGERFSLLLRTFPDRPELPLIAAALQDQWRAIGVELEVSVSNYSEIPAGHQDGSLHVALYARNYGLTPDPIGTVLSDFSAGGGDWGAMNWKAPGVAEALGEIAATADQSRRAPLIAEVSKTLHDELPLIPIIWYQHTVAVANGLEGVIVDPLERSYGLSHLKWAQ